MFIYVCMCVYISVYISLGSQFWLYFELGKQKPGRVYYLQMPSEACQETAPARSGYRYFINMCCSYVVFCCCRLGAGVPESTLCARRTCVLNRTHRVANTGQYIRLSAVEFLSRSPILLLGTVCWLSVSCELSIFLPFIRVLSTECFLLFIRELRTGYFGQFIL
jgi:hypothetical protein